LSACSSGANSLFAVSSAGASVAKVTRALNARRSKWAYSAEGIEGGAVYALSAALREAIATEGFATLTIDFKPDVGEAALAVALLRKAGPLPEGAEALSRRIKRCQ
jgi:predicted flavoprotein YhiN